MKLVPVILSGGAGSRLWPVSRLQHPKPFIRLADGQSLLQKAFLRAMGLQGVNGLTIVTNRDFFFKTEDEFREVCESKTSVSYILEPFGRNTAPAIAAAALQAFNDHGADAVLLVLAADHLISNESAFQQAVTQATELAVQGKLVTFGIQPHSPETGFGYIEAEGNTVLRFVEKPTLARAEEYIASGRFLWNSGMFCFTAGALLDEMRQHCPDMVSSVEWCIKRSRSANGEGFNQLELDGETFKEVPDDSIDYALMEKSTQVAVVPCDIGWSDIGSWLALGDLQPPDENGNRIQGEAELHKTHNCTIHSQDRLVGAVGVCNLVIIDTPDALLVANKTNAQDIKHIYTYLKSKGHDAHKLHQSVHRPWGTYTVLEQGVGCKIKRIEVNRPGF
jgi:mannose-1-phosphate guanylyltransferase/mannose-6-phosphate isomerase